MTDLSNVSDADLMSMLSAANAAPGAGLQGEIAAIHQNESSGASDARADIVNPASGARGSMQVLPKTAAAPGYGVTPSNGTPQDDARTGRDYYAALRQKYGAPDLAAIAYNWGPGNTDKWLAAGGDLSKLPDETLKYALSFKQQLGAASVPGVTDNPIPAPNATPDSSFVTKLAAGAGQGLGTAAAGVEALVGKGVSALGATDTGNAITGDARTAAARFAQQAADVGAGPDSGWGTAGRIIGGTAPMLFAGPELLPQIATGAAFGATQGALNDTGVLPGAVEGAGLGALGATAGYGIGKALGAAATAARPVASRVFDTVNGGERAATSRIGTALGGDIDDTVNALNTNSNEIIPGSLPTAAEAGKNTQLVGIQRALQNTEPGQIAFTDRMNANNAARWQAANGAVGPDLANEVDAFTQQQASRIAAGQAELPPVTQAQADIMQTPAYAQAMKNAAGLAENRGSTVFADQQAPLRQGLQQGIDSVAGTPQTLDALRAARGAGADETFRAANVSVPVDNEQFQALVQKPAFKKAFDVAQTTSDNLGEGSIFTQATNRANANLGGAKAVPQTYVSGRGMLYAKGYLDDQINRALQLGENAKARPLMQVRNELVGLMDQASPEYAAARARFQAESAPIDAQEALQKRLNGVVDPLSGEVSPYKLRQTVNSVAGEQMKPGIRDADKVTPQMLDQLRALGQEAKTTPTNMVGLQGEGQEYLRQALQDRVRASSDSLMRRESNQAAGNFNQYLSQNSPNYAEYLNQAGTTGVDLQSRQALEQALQKLSLGGHNTAGDPILTLNGAKSLLAGQAPLTGGARAFANNVISDLTRASAANNALGAAGSQTYANAQLGGGLIGRFLKSRTSDNAIIGGAAAGYGPVAAVALVVQKAAARAGAKTEKAAIDLLLDPKRLAKALQEFKGQPKAKQVFIDTLKQKASGAGLAGVRAVQAYNTNHAQGKRNNGESK